MVYKQCLSSFFMDINSVQLLLQMLIKLDSVWCLEFGCDSENLLKRQLNVIEVTSAGLYTSIGIKCNLTAMNGRASYIYSMFETKSPPWLWGSTVTSWLMKGKSCPLRLGLWYTHDYLLTSAVEPLCCRYPWDSINWSDLGSGEFHTL